MRELDDRAGAIDVDVLGDQHRAVARHAQQLGLGLGRQPSGHAGLLAQVVVDADRAQRLGDSRCRLQRLQHPFQARRPGNNAGPG